MIWIAKTSLKAIILADMERLVGLIYAGRGSDDALLMAIVGLFLISGAFAASVLLREEV